MFFTSIQKLLAGSQAVTIIVVPADEGRLAVTVASKMGDKADPALARPVSLIGTPDELDAEFGSLIGQYSSVRKTLAEQMAQATADLEAAKRAQKGKAALAVPAAVSISDLPPDDEGGDEGDATKGSDAPAAGLNLADLL